MIDLERALAKLMSQVRQDFPTRERAPASHVRLTSDSSESVSCYVLGKCTKIKTQSDRVIITFAARRLLVFDKVGS